MEVGFLGLGIMGKAMSMNLLKHGFKVTVWNRTLSKVKKKKNCLLIVFQYSHYQSNNLFRILHELN